MKSARRAKDPEPMEIDGPAVPTHLHVRDRPATDNLGKPIIGTAAWRRLTPLQAAYAKDTLSGGHRRFTAADRYMAGEDYTKIFDASQRSGKDSTQALNAIRGGSGGSSTGAQAKAGSDLICIHGHMGHKDRQIVELVCGMGYFPNVAIKQVCGDDYEKAVSARFREALDGLCQAFQATRNNPRLVNMERMA